MTNTKICLTDIKGGIYKKIFQILFFIMVLKLRNSKETPSFSSSHPQRIFHPLLYAHKLNSSIMNSKNYINIHFLAISKALHENMKITFYVVRDGRERLKYIMETIPRDMKTLTLTCHSN